MVELRLVPGAREGEDHTLIGGGIIRFLAEREQGQQEYEQTDCRVTCHDGFHSYIVNS